MDNPEVEIKALVHRLRPQVLQFHGNEDDAFCAGFGVPFLKALAMRNVAADNVAALLSRYPSAAGFVFDGHAPGAMGGSGERFDWNQLASMRIAQPWLLAGGLTASNVGVAIQTVRPWGVDVSSGIESDHGRLGPGIKDGAKMRAFVDAVRGTDEYLMRQSQDQHEQH
jgi:phosphoribosylanthranilate isomerase